MREPRIQCNDSEIPLHSTVLLLLFIHPIFGLKGLAGNMKKNTPNINVDFAHLNFVYFSHCVEFDNNAHTHTYIFLIVYINRAYCLNAVGVVLSYTFVKIFCIFMSFHVQFRVTELMLQKCEHRTWLICSRFFPSPSTAKRDHRKNKKQKEKRRNV